MRRALTAPLTLALLVLPAWLGAAAADEILVDGIAAQVGTDIVLVSEVMQLVAEQERHIRSRGATEADVARVRSQALEAMIEQHLIERVVRDADLKATDAEVDATIEAIARENDLSMTQLQRSVTSQNMDWEKYRGEIRRELERRKAVNAIVGSTITVDDDEIEALYHDRHADQPDEGTEVHLRQILVPANEERGVSLPEACRLAHRARSRVTSGEPFAEVAAKYSAIAVQHGGDLGWVHLGSVADWMLELIAPLEPGQLSGVLELPVACTFVQLVERKQWNPVTLEETRVQLQQELFERKLMVEYRDWIEQLRARTFIERRGYFAEAARFTKQNGTNDFEAGLSGHSMLGGSPEVEAPQ